MDAGIEALVKALRTGNLNEQEEAQQALVQLGGEAVKPLIGLLSEYKTLDDVKLNTDPFYQAQNTLVQIGEPAVEPLITVLQANDSPWGARRAAVDALEQIGDVRAVQPLLEALRFDDISPADISAGLLEMGEAAVDPLIFTLRNNENSEIRSQVTILLKDLHAPLAIPALIEMLEREKDATARNAMVYALGEFRDARAIEPLIAIVSDTDPALREEAVRSLGQIGEEIESPRIIDALAARLGDEDWGTWQSAAEMLIRLNAPQKAEAERALITDLESENVEIQLGAAWSLVAVGDERALEPLVKLLYHPEARIAAYAAQGLGNLGDQRAVIPLTVTLSHEDEEVSRAAKRALARLEAED